MKPSENSQPKPDPKQATSGDAQSKKGKAHALELGEQAEHEIGPRKEQLIRKAKQESA